MNALEFYHKNKNHKSFMPPLPSNVKNDLEIASWLLNESDFKWLELDISFDLKQWKLETNAAKFVSHRGEMHPGWNSSCIHGIDVHKTGAWTNYGDWKDESEVPYKWTSISEHTPNIKEFWSNFPYESYRRIRFMELEPNGTIQPHSDAPGRLPGETGIDMLEFGVPINIAIIHPNNCYMTLENSGIVPFVEGKAFIINIRNYHSFINFSSSTRIHLIAHGKPGTKKDKFAKLIADSYFKQLEKEK